MKPKRKHLFLLTVLILLVAGVYVVSAAEMAVSDDPLIRLPGTQPNQVTLESPNRCLNCHAGYNESVEPGFNWQGSMMAQAARDFLFWSCMTVAAQDSIWAIGRPNATDICERCHFPEGWLEGRSDPTNASLMTGSDYDGVQCDFCHQMYDPFFEDTYLGNREGVGLAAYWDETNLSDTPSDGAAAATHNEDWLQAQTVQLFNGAGFFAADKRPQSSIYLESGSGQFFVSDGGEKRASFTDAAARHQTYYSRFHKSKYFCSTCHDVSNPILANLVLGEVGLEETVNDFPAGRTLWTEDNSAYAYFHVERTFSEFMLSDYGLDGGAQGIGPFGPGLFTTSDPDNNIRMCQDCHMRDVVGSGANKNGTIFRPTDSIEHPDSGQPLHDLTGGNAWVSWVLASAVPGSPNYDPFNDQQLNQGPAVLTLDLTQGLGIDANALLAGVNRAKEQLQLAASIEDLSFNGGQLSFRLQNQTGHKLISGFPEGRRMFINVKAYEGGPPPQGALIYEINPYDPNAYTLKGLSYNYQDGFGLPLPQAIDANSEAYLDEYVYEVHPSSSLTGEDETFHFALATGRYKDNRIPPLGFRIDEAAERMVQPVWHGVVTPGYFSPEEYAGGYDEVSITLPTQADYVEVNLYYQTTSREYIEFLRDEINANPSNLTLDPSAYVIDTDPFFNQLGAWGDTIWQLWTYNKEVPGAAPFPMAQATIGLTPPPCTASPPTLASADPSSQQVTLTWLDVPDIVGYKVYYDQSGKSQFLADAGLTTTFVDTGLQNGLQYCYKVTAYTSECESGFSNILCAIPDAGGQIKQKVTVGGIETGKWVTTGKGKDRVTEFVATSEFNPGDEIVIGVTIVDGATGLPISGALVDMIINGPETVNLTTGPSDDNGVAQATWLTKAPGKRNQPGTAAGVYSAAVTGVTATGYDWDGVSASTTFTIQ